MRYDKRNKAALLELAPNTRVAALEWYNYCLRNKVEILVTDARRTEEEQRDNVRRGVSQTMRSYHLVGQAFDFVPIIDGIPQWPAESFLKEPWHSAVAYAKKLGFEWGGDWKTFKDYYHLQFNYKGYGTDKVLEVKPVDNVPGKSVIVEIIGKEIPGAYVTHGTTFVPLRELVEALGHEIVSVDMKTGKIVVK